MSLTFILLATLISFCFTQNIDSSTIWGDCAIFSVHAGTAVSFNGALTTVSTGSVGVSPGTSITGSYSLGTGAIEPNTASAVNCASSKLITYNNLTGQTCPPANLLASRYFQTTLLSFSWHILFCIFSSNLIVFLFFLMKISDLAGLTLLPGVYCSASGFFTFTSGTLTLNGNGSAGTFFIIYALFILYSISFQISLIYRF